MRRLTDIIKRAARTDVPILILGESGDIDHGHVFNADGFLVFGQGAGVIASSLHPGFVATRFGDEGKGIGASGFRLLKHLALTPEEGAKTMIFLASASRSHSQEKQNKRLHNR
jgi:hypothetical protein